MAALPVTLMHRAATRVAYLRHTGPYGATLSRFHATHVAPWLQRHGWMGRERFGISLDDPAYTAPARCRYDACVALPDQGEPPANVLTMTLPTGLHAVLPFEGTADEIAGAWQRLFREWMPDHGLQQGKGHGFEHYPVGSRHDPATGVFQCRICIPVEPL